MPIFSLRRLTSVRLQKIKESASNEERKSATLPWSNALCHALACCVNLRALSVRGDDAHEDDDNRLARGLRNILSSCRKVRCLRCSQCRDCVLFAPRQIETLELIVKDPSCGPRLSEHTAVALLRAKPRLRKLVIGGSTGPALDCLTESALAGLQHLHLFWRDGENRLCGGRSLFSSPLRVRVCRMVAPTLA